MRKYLKDNCYETLKLLKEAQSSGIQCAKRGDIPNTLEVLEQCQQAAISLGNLIEKYEDPGSEIVGRLEEYCEMIFHIYQDLQSGGAQDLNMLQAKMDGYIDSTVSTIEAMPTELETVFLPYKASMWDSLESVWKKADADPLCHAYVIPIPYCDRNPDGSVKEVHYEADQYPKYVPITNYTEYDFEERHPDQIYIHNPYDGNNYVTSVDPFFYSENMKQFTNELIYIPYFVLSEPPKPDAKNFAKYLEGLEKFVLVPGVVNADKTIVQSEEMKDCYVRVLTKHMGRDTKKIWEERILGLGSPKIDKVLNTHIEDLEIPEEWKKIYTNADGKRKKIVLYNTSLAALLKNDEQMIQKIQDVLKIFKENSEEVVVLWRPHPLLEATLESMRPELVVEYRKLKQDFLAEGYGIFDETADLDRAIILSDAYYGDWSSVVWLYQKTEKPIMIQNPKIIDGELIESVE